jgi:hypothetical protein
MPGSIIAIAYECLSGNVRNAVDSRYYGLMVKRQEACKKAVQPRALPDCGLSFHALLSRNQMGYCRDVEAASEGRERLGGFRAVRHVSLEKAKNEGRAIF